MWCERIRGKWLAAGCPRIYNGSGSEKKSEAYMNQNVWKHFKVITRHKWEVMKNCFRLGLYKQGLLHDLSKYSPTEFRIGVKYFQGDRSPNAAERDELGYSTAWMHHKGRNKHHFEYWTDVSKDRMQLVGVKMPPRYLAEMFADRVAASKIYKGKDYTDRTSLDYFKNGTDYALMHPDTYKELLFLLTMLAEKGEKKTFHYIRKKILKNSK